MTTRLRELELELPIYLVEAILCRSLVPHIVRASGLSYAIQEGACLYADCCGSTGCQQLL